MLVLYNENHLVVETFKSAIIKKKKKEKEYLEGNFPGRFYKQLIF